MFRRYEILRRVHTKPFLRACTSFPARFLRTGALKGFSFPFLLRQSTLNNGGQDVFGLDLKDKTRQISHLAPWAVVSSTHSEHLGMNHLGDCEPRPAFEFYALNLGTIVTIFNNLADKLTAWFYQSIQILGYMKSKTTNSSKNWFQFRDPPKWNTPFKDEVTPLIINKPNKFCAKPSPTTGWRGWNQVPKKIKRRCHRMTKKATLPETTTRRTLVEMGLNFKQQFPIHAQSRWFIADFYLPDLKMILEVDGGSHRTPAGLKYDKFRTEAIRSNGLKVARVDNEVMHNIMQGIYIIGSAIQNAH